MTIGDRVLEKISELGMTQKEFSEKTGIAQSTISEWKTKRTNPTSEKIMIICNVLNVSPEWLLSGSENTGMRGNKLDWILVYRHSELGEILSSYNKMDESTRARLLGYVNAINMMRKELKKGETKDSK